MSPEQIRGACGLLGITQKDLSEKVGITRANLRKYDQGELEFTTKSMDKLTAFFENNRIVFLENNGVSIKPLEDIQKLYGRHGFIAFMNDVYEVTKRQGGEICVSNVDERNWIKWMTEPLYEKHSKMMSKLGNFTFKILIEHSDTFFIASDIAEYRYVLPEYFNDQSFYAYGNKLALIAFDDNDVRINIIESDGWSQSFRKLFNLAWDNSPATESM